MDSAKDLKHKISQEGFPLQRYCSWKLQRLGWQVDEEYPVLWTSRPDSQTSKYVRTSGDIRAGFQYAAKGFAVKLCISCKRQDKIEWAFMNSMFTESSHALLRLCGFKNADKTRNGWEYSYNFENADWPDSYHFCNIPTTLLDRERGGSNDGDKILKTADNLYLELKQTVKDDVITFGSIETIPYDQIIYIPIIVTGAVLYSYDINEENFAVNDSTCIDLKDASYLLYQHRLPIDMQTQVGNPHVDKFETFDRLNIFVVHYKEFERFVKLLQSYFEKKTIPHPDKT